MRKRVSLIACTALIACAQAVAAGNKEETGKDIAFDRSRGNCLACHAMPTLPDAEQPGNSGPPLIAMSARFPDKNTLRAKIHDATAGNPDSFMPPYGKHGVLTEEELGKVVDFVYGL
ncbi:MAG: sulfur oxidation c-type cytochrome SoxX [Thiobacillaceae bacterium]|jgi:sulfur-oxidizing protein SoxX|nr:sulfur oxidation c-type cytochrome SoxX [Thiobacillaceae bacterium]